MLEFSYGPTRKSSNKKIRRSLWPSYGITSINPSPWHIEKLPLNRLHSDHIFYKEISSYSCVLPARKLLPTFADTLCIMCHIKTPLVWNSDVIIVDVVFVLTNGSLLVIWLSVYFTLFKYACTWFETMQRMSKITIVNVDLDANWITKIMPLDMQLLFSFVVLYYVFNAFIYN